MSTRFLTPYQCPMEPLVWNWSGAAGLCRATQTLALDTHQPSLLERQDEALDSNLGFSGLSSGVAWCGQEQSLDGIAFTVRLNDIQWLQTQGVVVGRWGARDG